MKINIIVKYWRRRFCPWLADRMKNIYYNTRLDNYYKYNVKKITIIEKKTHTHIRNPTKITLSRYLYSSWRSYATVHNRIQIYSNVKKKSKIGWLEFFFFFRHSIRLLFHCTGMFVNKILCYFNESSIIPYYMNRAMR